MRKQLLSFSEGLFPETSTSGWTSAVSSGRTNGGDKKWMVLTVLQGSVLTWLLVEQDLVDISRTKTALKRVLTSACDVGVQFGKSSSVASFVGDTLGLPSVVTILYDEGMQTPILAHLFFRENEEGRIHFHTFDPCAELLSSRRISASTGRLEDQLRVGSVGKVIQWADARCVFLIHDQVGDAFRGFALLCQVVTEGCARVVLLDSVPIDEPVQHSGAGLFSNGKQVPGTEGWATPSNRFVWRNMQDSEHWASIEPFVLSFPNTSASVSRSLTMLLPSFDRSGCVQEVNLLSFDANPSPDTSNPDFFGAAVNDSPRQGNLDCDTAEAISHTVSTQDFLSKALRVVFAHDGPLLTQFPWLLDLSGDVTCAVFPSAEEGRDVAAQLWPIFTESVATADDWRYMDPLGTPLLEGLLILALPFDSQTVDDAVRSLSLLLSVPSWYLRSFLIMQPMLPSVYAHVMLWYLLYIRTPGDTLFHPSVPPLSTLLHPEVDLNALQQTIAVVFSNIVDVKTAEAIWRTIANGVADATVRTDFIASWWSLQHPMAIDSVVMLYTFVLGSDTGIVDEQRTVSAAATLMQTFIMDQLMFPKATARLDWEANFSTQPPFIWAQRSMDLLNVFERVAILCTNIALISPMRERSGHASVERRTDENTLVPFDVAYCASIIRLAFQCSLSVTSLNAVEKHDDHEVQDELVSLFFIRSLVLGEMASFVYEHYSHANRHPSIHTTITDEEVVKYSMQRVPWVSGGDDVPSVLETLFRALCESSLGTDPMTTLPAFVEYCLESCVKEFLRLQNSFADCDAVASLTDSFSSVEEGHDTHEVSLQTQRIESLRRCIFPATPWNSPETISIRLAWLSVIRKVIRKQPVMTTVAKLITVQRFAEGVDVEWDMAQRVAATDLFSSPMQFSKALDREVNVFDLSFFYFGGESVLCVGATLCCELLDFQRHPDGLEGRIAKLCNAVSNENCASTMEHTKFLLVFLVSATLIQKSLTEFGVDDFYRDLLTWRISRYVGFDLNRQREAIHAALLPVTDSVFAVVNAILEGEGVGSSSTEATFAWYTDCFLSHISQPIDEASHLHVLHEVEEVEMAGRESIDSSEAHARSTLRHMYFAEGFASGLLDLHQKTANNLLSQRTMCMAELWERISILWLLEDFTFMEVQWMTTVGGLWEEVLAGRKAIIEEEDVEGRDAIAAQFALEDYRIQSRLAKGDISSAEEDIEDWVSEGYPDLEPSDKAQREFSVACESIRDALVALGIKSS